MSNEEDVCEKCANRIDYDGVCITPCLDHSMLELKESSDDKDKCDNCEHCIDGACLVSWCNGQMHYTPKIIPREKPQKEFLEEKRSFIIFKGQNRKIKRKLLAIKSMLQTMYTEIEEIEDIIQIDAPDTSFTINEPEHVNYEPEQLGRDK